LEPAVRDLVDARSPRSRGMTLAHRDEHQSGLRGFFVA
jgi:hypothetical protein